LPGHYCIRSCDRNLHKCLSSLTRRTLGSMAASWAFGEIIPNLFH
jgi:hypothetical protein